MCTFYSQLINPRSLVLPQVTHSRAGKDAKISQRPGDNCSWLHPGIVAPNTCSVLWPLHPGHSKEPGLGQGLGWLHSHMGWRKVPKHAARQTWGIADTRCCPAVLSGGAQGSEDAIQVTLGVTYQQALPAPLRCIFLAVTFCLP